MKKVILIITLLLIANQTFAGNTYNFYFEDGEKSKSKQSKKVEVKTNQDEDNDSEYYSDNDALTEGEEEAKRKSNQNDDEDEGEYTGPITFSGSMPPQPIQRPGLIAGLFKNTSKNYISLGIASESQMDNDAAYILRAKLLPIITFEATMPTQDNQDDKLHRFGFILESDHTKNFAFQVNFGSMYSGTTVKLSPYVGLGYRIRLFNHVDLSFAGGKLLGDLKHEYESDEYEWSLGQGGHSYTKRNETFIDSYFSAGISLAFPFGRGVL